MSCASDPVIGNKAGVCKLQCMCSLLLCVEFCILFYLSCVLYHQEVWRAWDAVLGMHPVYLVCGEETGAGQGWWHASLLAAVLLKCRHLWSPVWEVKYSDSSATCYQQSGKYDQFLVLRGGGGQVCWIQTHEWCGHLVMMVLCQ